MGLTQVGVYAVFYFLSLMVNMRYIQGSLTLQKNSIGQTLGLHLFLLVVGLVCGVVIAILTGYGSGLLHILYGFIYFLSILTSLQNLKDYVERYSRKKVGLVEYNKYSGHDKFYIGIKLAMLLGLILLYVGLFMTNSTIQGLGVGLIVIHYLNYYRYVSKVIVGARYLTLDERQARLQKFDEAVESEDLGALEVLDNNDDTTYKNAQRKLKKYYKKRR